MPHSNPTLVATLLALTACTGNAPTQIIDPALWTVITPDPIDPDVTCGEDALQLEEGLVEVDTTLCGTVTLTQPSLARVREGDALDLFAFHSALSAAEPGEGHMAIWLDGTLLWEVRPPIPSTELIYLETVTAAALAPAGSEVRLHIANHGGNSWRFVSLERI